MSRSRPRGRAGRLWALGAIAIGVLAAACGGGDTDPASSSPTAAAGASTASAGPASSSPTAAAEASTDVATPLGQPIEIAGAGAFDWRLWSIDRGTKPGIAVGGGGQPLIAYMLERMRGEDGFVRVALIQDGVASSSDVDAGDYYYGPLDIEISARGELAVAFHQHSWEDGAVAFGTPVGWSILRIEDGGHDGWDSSVAFGSDGSAHFLGIDPVQFGSSEGIEYARLIDDSWVVEAVGSGPQPYEWGVDLAIDSSGTAHLVYFDAEGKDLVYGSNATGDWVLTAIFEDGDAGRFAVLALGAADQPHVAFIQTSGFFSESGSNRVDVVYGSNDGSGWAFEVVGSLGDLETGFEGARRTVALELASDSTPVVAFIDASRLAIATREGETWTEETIVEAADAPLQVVGLALDALDAPHLTYATTTESGPLDGQVWYVEPVARA